MRRSVIYITILFLIILLASRCKKSDFSTSGQVILFQYDYVRGINHHGFIIDNGGNVFTYNTDEMNFPDRDLEIRLDKADEYLGQCEFSGIKIAGEELLKYARYIEYIASSKVTAPRDTRVDTGTIRFICYQFDESSGLYIGQLIKMEGDYTRENLNFHSRKVSSWMREIGRELSIE